MILDSLDGFVCGLVGARAQARARGGVVVALAFLLASLVVTLAGCPKIACNSDDNCPTGQFCNAGLCTGTPAPVVDAGTEGEGEGAGEGEGEGAEGEGEGAEGEGEGAAGEGEGEGAEGEGEGGGALVLVERGFATSVQAPAAGGFVLLDAGFERSDMVCSGALCLTGGIVP